MVNELQLEKEKFLETINELKKQFLIEEIAELDMKELIGRGEYGEVYKAEWRFSNVAVKKYYNLSDFYDEVDILKNIRHPNIVTLMAICKNPPMLITEYMALGDLGSVIHSNKKLSKKQLIEISVDIARGLIFLHTAVPSIVHRDLKSANCLVDKNFNVKICDFGLAKIKDTTLKDSSAFGTFPYMAPEVIIEQKYSVKSDVYAFGILL